MSDRPRGAARAARAGELAARGAVAADAGAIARVHRESWRTTYTGILPLAVIEREAGGKSEAAWRHRLEPARASRTTLVAELPGAGIVGFVSCGESREPLAGIEAEIYALYVLQEHQRRGIGRALVRASARHFVRQALFSFHLWVLKANRARLFYETLGGVAAGEKTETLGGHPFGQIAYAWRDLTDLVAK